MRHDQLVEKWLALGNAYQLGKARVYGAALCAEFVRDLQLVDITNDDELVTLAEAARLSGYSQQHLRLLIREGKLLSERSGKARVVRRSSLPRKPTVVAPTPPTLHLPGAKAEQVVRETVGASKGPPR